MGPRLISRGVNQMGKTMDQLAKASMGPRLISRGVDLRVVGYDSWGSLQWGRGSLAAACVDLACRRSRGI